MARLLIGIVELWKQRSRTSHGNHDHHAHHHGCRDDPCIRLLCLFHPACTQQLTYNNRHRVSHGDERDIEHVIDGVGDILPCDCIQAAQRVGLVLKEDAHRPERLIDQERCSGDEELLHNRQRHLHRPIDTPDIGMGCAVPVQPDHDNGTLHHSGQVGCESRAVYAQLRESELAVDQQIVEHQVDKDSRHASFHGHQRLTALSQGAGIDDADKQNRHPQENKMHVPHAIAQRCLQVSAAFTFIQEHADQIFSKEKHDCHGNCRDSQSQPQFIAECMADPIVILVPEILRSKDTCTGQASEQAQEIDEHDLVDDGHTGHLLRAHPSDHNIVQKADKVGDAVLDHDRHRHSHKRFIKCPVTYVLIASYLHTVFSQLCLPELRNLFLYPSLLILSDSAPICISGNDA